MDIRMKSEIPPLKTEEGFYVPLNNPRREICKHITKHINLNLHLRSPYTSADRKI